MTAVNPNTTSVMKTSTVRASLPSLMLLFVLILFVPVAVVLCIVLAIVGLAWWLGVIIALVAAGLLVWGRVRSADTYLLRAVGAVATDSASEPRLCNVVEGLSLTGGVSEPDTFLVHDSALNACVVKADNRSSILVTSGLVEKLSVVELEGVVAQLITRLKSGDAEVATAAGALVAPLLSGPIKWLGVKVLAWVFVDDRDFTVDSQAVTLTRYPPGLRVALEKIRDGSTAVTGSSAAYSPTWLVSSSAVGSSFSEDSEEAAHLALNLRVDVLGEL